MGRLHYGHEQTFEFDDRTLAHLRSVVVVKLTLQESVVFTWDADGTRRTIWLHPSIPVTFEFDSTDNHEINHTWLDQLMGLANGRGGLVLTPEPAEEPKTRA